MFSNPCCCASATMLRTWPSSLASNDGYSGSGPFAKHGAAPQRANTIKILLILYMQFSCSCSGHKTPETPAYGQNASLRRKEHRKRQCRSIRSYDAFTSAINQRLQIADFCAPKNIEQRCDTSSEERRVGK